MLFSLPYPAIDPIIISIGPLAIRWYALAYIGGLLLGWQGMKRLSRHSPKAMTEQHAEDMLLWLTLGVVVGGRIGYVLFYDLAYFLDYPSKILQVWLGGMSFHGGILGVAVAGYMFVRKYDLEFLKVADVVACVSPIGLFFGRIANFINGEHFGRPTDVGWAMVFPRGGPEPRHPSQLYEAMLEGLLLFIILHLLWRNEAIRTKPGILTGVFLAGYALARGALEFVRVPDQVIDLALAQITIGQLLSLPMLLIGLYLIIRGRKTQ
jgi:phosphatidylglycerol:prolipoprotein diacylglycerol transferase